MNEIPTYSVYLHDYGEISSLLSRYSLQLSPLMRKINKKIFLIYKNEGAYE
jgi:hypothetical protein